MCENAMREMMVVVCASAGGVRTFHRASVSYICYWCEKSIPNGDWQEWKEVGMGGKRNRSGWCIVESMRCSLITFVK